VPVLINIKIIRIEAINFLKRYWGCLHEQTSEAITDRTVSFRSPVDRCIYEFIAHRLCDGGIIIIALGCKNDR
jgi:hypothetical protein